jgi:hypothetical protein
MKITVDKDKNIYADKLGKELDAAGIDHNGISPLSSGRLIIHLVNEEKDAELAKTIVENHDGSDDPDLLLWV